MLPEKTTGKPDKPFLYIAGRAYSSSEEWMAESLTEEKGDALAKFIGK